MRGYGFLFLLFVICFFCPRIVLAEGGCPAGYYPISGEGWSSCAPMPDGDGAEENSPAPINSPSWKTQWIAIATGSGAFGVGKDQPSKRKAESLALADCKKKGGKKCKLYLQTYNQCIALAGGARTLSVFTAETKDQSEALAIKKCGVNPANGQCEVYYSGCSYPVRVN